MSATAFVAAALLLAGQATTGQTPSTTPPAPAREPLAPATPNAKLQPIVQDPEITAKFEAAKTKAAADKQKAVPAIYVAPYQPNADEIATTLRLRPQTPKVSEKAGLGTAK